MRLERIGVIQRKDERSMSKSETDRYEPRPKTLIFCGISRLPENVTAKHVFGYLSVELEIDPVDLSRL
jgi:5-formyltetrahydrofolate cyclo-ligase